MKKVLLLGGTGAMGAHLTRILAEQGENVFVTSRRSRKTEFDNVHYFQGDAKDENFVRALLEKKFDVIVDFMVYSTPIFNERHKLFLDNCEQYVFLSSSRVYANNCGNAITEDSPRLLDVSSDEEYLKTDEYALTKARQENILRGSGKNNWTIIRPYITYSEIRLQLGVLEKEDWLQRALQGKTIVFSKDIAEHKTTLTYGFDVARGIAAIIGEEKALGEAFHITGNESMKWSEILEIYLNTIEKLTGTRPNVLLTEKSQNLRHGKYQVIYDRYFDRVFDNSKIDKFIDTKSFLSSRVGIVKSLEEFLKNPEFLGVNLRAEALKDRTCGNWTFPRNLTLEQFIKYFILRTIYPKNKL